MKLFRICIFFLLSINFLHAASAAQKGSREEAIALVKKAAVFLKENGKEKAFAAFSDPNGQFVKGDLYIFSYSTNGDGINLAHGQNPKMVGKPLLEMRDVDGVYLVKEFLAVANSQTGNGWVDYKWPNSLSKTIEQKSAYIEKVGDVFLGCGIYK